MEKGLVVRTGVDRLLELLRGEGNISLKNAALKLGVSTGAVLGWAKMLEEEGLLNIRYKFSTAYLEGKNLSSKEYKKQKKELMAEKQVVDERLQSTNHFLISLEKEVGTLKKIYGDLGHTLDKNMKRLQRDLKTLTRYQEQKDKTDKKIVTSKAKFLEKVHNLNEHLSKEKQAAKEWYRLLYNQVTRGGELLTLERNELKVIEENEKIIEERLANIRALLDKKVIRKIAATDKDEKKIEGTLAALQKKYLKMSEECAKEKKALNSLIESNEKNVDGLEKKQKDLVEKMESLAGDFDVTMDELKELPKKMQKFFDKKSIVEELLNKLHYNELQFRKKLDKLMLRSRIIEKEINLKAFKKELRDVEKELNELRQKRGEFKGELKQLVSVLKT